MSSLRSYAWAWDFVAGWCVAHFDRLAPCVGDALRQGHAAPVALRRASTGRKWRRRCDGSRRKLEDAIVWPLGARCVELLLGHGAHDRWPANKGRGLLMRGARKTSCVWWFASPSS